MNNLYSLSLLFGIVCTLVKVSEEIILVFCFALVKIFSFSKSVIKYFCVILINSLLVHKRLSMFFLHYFIYFFVSNPWRRLLMKKVTYLWRYFFTVRTKNALHINGYSVVVDVLSSGGWVGEPTLNLSSTRRSLT